MAADLAYTHVDAGSDSGKHAFAAAAVAAIAMAEEHSLMTPRSASPSNTDAPAITKSAAVVAEASMPIVGGAPHTPPAEDQEELEPSSLYYATSALTEAMGTTMPPSKPIELAGEASYASHLEGDDEQQYQEDLLNDSGFGLPTRVQTISTTHPDPSNPNGPPVTTISYLCPWESCAKSFSRYFNLRSHYRIHSGEKPYACPDCALAFARNHDLKRHARIHSGQKPYVCPHCHKTFSRNDAMSRHVRLASCLARSSLGSREGSPITSLEDSHQESDPRHAHHHSHSHGDSASDMLMEGSGRCHSRLRYNRKNELSYLHGYSSEREDTSDMIGEPHSAGARDSLSPFPYSPIFPRLMSPLQPYGSSGAGMLGLYSTPSPYYGEPSPVTAAATATSINPHAHGPPSQSLYYGPRSTPHFVTTASYYAHHSPYYSIPRFPMASYGTGNPFPSPLGNIVTPAAAPTYSNYQIPYYRAFPYNSRLNAPSSSPLSSKVMPSRHSDNYHTSPATAASHLMPLS